MPVKTYRELLVWKAAIEFVVMVYRLTARFPKEEQYGLTSQLRRCAVSVPSNIAEGQGRGIGNEFRHHLRISQGSLQEAETQLLIAEELKFAPQDQIAPVMNKALDVGKMLRGLYQSVANN